VGLGARLAKLRPRVTGTRFTTADSVAVANVSAARSGAAGAVINVARMAAATIGVAVLGAAFAATHGGAAGLRIAMLCGDLVQSTCARQDRGTVVGGHRLRQSLPTLPARGGG
jgi:hypothetical protein